MSTATETFREGDLVELISPIPGRPKLAVGTRGRVLVGSDGAAWGLLTVSLGSTTRPWQLHARHLALVERAAVAPEAD